MYTPDIRTQKCSDCQHVKVCSMYSNRKITLELKIKELFTEDIDQEDVLAVEVKCKHFVFKQQEVRVGFAPG